MSLSVIGESKFHERRLSGPWFALDPQEAMMFACFLGILPVEIGRVSDEPATCCSVCRLDGLEPVVDLIEP
jgi:hypothetical protein